MSIISSTATKSAGDLEVDAKAARQQALLALKTKISQIDLSKVLTVDDLKLVLTDLLSVLNAIL